MEQHPLTIDSFVGFMQEIHPDVSATFVRNYMEKLISGEYRLANGLLYGPDVLDSNSNTLFSFSTRSAYEFCRRVVEYQRSRLTIDGYIALVTAESSANETIRSCQEKFIRHYMEKLISGEYQLSSVGRFRVLDADSQIVCGFENEKFFDACKRVVEAERIREEPLVAFAARVEPSASNYTALVSFLNDCISDEQRPEQGHQTVIRSCGLRWIFSQAAFCTEVFAIIKREREKRANVERGVRVHEFVGQHLRAPTRKRAIEEPGAGSQPIIVRANPPSGLLRAEPRANPPSGLLRAEPRANPPSGLLRAEPRANPPSGLLRARAIVRAVTRTCDSAGTVDMATVLDQALVALTRALSRTGAASCDGEARVMRVVFEKDSPIPANTLPEIKGAIAQEVLEHLPSARPAFAEVLGTVLIAFANWNESFGASGSAVLRADSIEREGLLSDLQIEE